MVSRHPRGSWSPSSTHTSKKTAGESLGLRCGLFRPNCIRSCRLGFLRSFRKLQTIFVQRYDVYNKMKDSHLVGAWSDRDQPRQKAYRRVLQSSSPPGCCKNHDFFTKTKDKQLYDGANACCARRAKCFCDVGCAPQVGVGQELLPIQTSAIRRLQSEMLGCATSQPRGLLP